MSPVVGVFIVCGIFGFSSRDSSLVTLKKMAAAVRHRGREATGFYRDSKIALGNVLLATVDIGNGKQPFIREWATTKGVCVFDGEIYNHRELRDKLEDEGVLFQTSCDTEVALYSLMIWGDNAFEMWDGQWAIGFWNATSGELTLSRDPFGIRPLYLSFKNENSLGFASEPKALFHLPWVEKGPNLEAIAEYFLHGFAFAAGYTTSGRSYYEGIQSLPPGSVMSWSPGGARSFRSHFHLRSLLLEQRRPMTASQAAEELHGRVWKSTLSSSMGEAPLGISLSGGLDSRELVSDEKMKEAPEGWATLLPDIYY